jgi:hypothetical protein
MNVVMSLNDILIRLTGERWVHIVENHDDLAGKQEIILETIADPDLVLGGTTGELLAICHAAPHSMVVVYREVNTGDGFVITAFQTSRVEQIIKSRKIVWNKQQSKKRLK